MRLLYKKRPMLPDPTTSETERLNAWLERVTRRAGPFELSPIRGGASPRRFQRVTLGAERAVVMVVPPETPDVAFATERGRAWPFLELRDLLEARGIRVPALLAASCEEGLLLVEDLGPTLAERLEEAEHEREHWYRHAVRDLARAQAALDPLPADSVVRLRQFDAALYRYELEHFWEWAIAARNIDAPRAPFQRALDYILHELSALPRAFTHRDYQSRNLLVTPRRDAPDERELGWIDFQDALLGPRAYDLVALLCDSYQPFDRSFVEQRLDDYAAARVLDAAERLALGREFDLLTLQRKLKDAGRFVFIERRRGDPSFLPFVGPTLEIVLDALDRLADSAELRELRPLVEAARNG
jgi:aminoglycoside/choline kinase family phosphotransferase